jgi:hypothetical protein
MPLYCFKCDTCGAYTEEHRSMADSSKPKPCVNEVCDSVMRRDMQSEQSGRRSRCDTYPYPSDALGVNPSQVQQFMENDRKHGVPTEYTPEGQPIMRDRAHRRRYCKLYGVVDRNAGYSDPQ